MLAGTFYSIGRVSLTQHVAYLTSPDSQTLNSNKKPSKVTWKVWGRFLCFYCAINPSQTKLIYFRCTCGNCQILNRNEECTCCSEFSQFCDKNREAVETGEVAEAPVCITQHPGFQAVCLNRWVLQTAWYQYKQQYSQSYEGPQHKLNRHVAYRHLVRWCWGVLGKEIRVPLPSCAVCCIRAHFPPPGLEDNFQFEGFHFPDE